MMDYSWAKENRIVSGSLRVEKKLFVDNRCDFKLTHVKGRVHTNQVA